MILIDQFGREIGIGDAVIPKDHAVQNWVVASIESTGISPAPDVPPMTKVVLRCELTINVMDIGQARQAVPLFRIRSKEEADMAVAAAREAHFA